MPAALRPCLAAAASARSPAPGVQLRPGRPEDRGAIWRMVIQEKLNPLGLDPSRFTVAERRGPAGGPAELVGIGQLKPLSGGAALELASLVVAESARGQGVGTALVGTLVERAGGQPLYLTTISQRAALYKRCGFEEVSCADVPSFLQFEYSIGLFVAWLAVRDRLVLMRLAPASGSASGSTAATAQSAAAQERPDR